MTVPEQNKQKHLSIEICPKLTEIRFFDLNVYVVNHEKEPTWEGKTSERPFKCGKH